MEEIAGFSRAVRVGPYIAVGGTAPVDPDGNTVRIGDPAARARRCIEIIRGALEQAGSSLEDVIRIRILLPRIEDWEVIVKVCGERIFVPGPGRACRKGIPRTGARLCGRLARRGLVLDEPKRDDARCSSGYGLNPLLSQAGQAIACRRTFAGGFANWRWEREPAWIADDLRTIETRTGEAAR